MSTTDITAEIASRKLRPHAEVRRGSDAGDLGNVISAIFDRYSVDLLVERRNYLWSFTPIQSFAEDKRLGQKIIYT